MTSTTACQLRPCCTPPANRRLLSPFRNRFRTLMSMATIDVSFRFYLECRYRSVWAQTTQRGDMKRVDHGSRYRHPQCKRRASQSARAFFSSECINICRCHLFFFLPRQNPHRLVCVRIVSPTHRWHGLATAWLGDARTCMSKSLRGESRVLIIHNPCMAEMTSAGRGGRSHVTGKIWSRKQKRHRRRSAMPSDAQ